MSQLTVQELYNELGALLEQGHSDTKVVFAHKGPTGSRELALNIKYLTVGKTFSPGKGSYYIDELDDTTTDADLAPDRKGVTVILS